MRYATHDLDHEQKLHLLRAAHAVATAWWVDKLDCRISPIRERVEMPFEQALALFKPDTLLTVIHRKHEDVLEVGFRASDPTRLMELEWFLFVVVPYPEATHVVETSGLHPA